MILGLDALVGKAIRPHGFPQQGVFTLDLFQYFGIVEWLPLVLFGELQRTSQGSNSKASRVSLE